ncbi:hypothetical protein ABFV99_13135 [Cytobacillus horneckiae]|uniref:hypothetical protein n=1 Tax=Cytobacillus horneckiae TaxID=549687 RepID=UPI0034CD24CD
MKKGLLLLLLPFFIFLSACTQNQSYDVNGFSYGLGETKNAESNISFEIEIIIPDDKSKNIDISSIKPIVSPWIEDKVKDVNIKDANDNVYEDENIYKIKGEVTFDNNGLSYDELEELNEKEPAFLGVSFINEDEEKYDITFLNNKVSVKEIK